MSVKPTSSTKPWNDPDDAPALTEADMLRGTWRVGDVSVEASVGKALQTRAAELLAAHAPAGPSSVSPSD